MTASITPQTTPAVPRAIRVDPACGAHAAKSAARGAAPEALSEALPEALPVSRSLVPVESARPHNPERAIAFRPVSRHAAFCAHLIATNARAPQTCARRRTAPQDGALAYRAAASAPAKPLPRVLRTA